MERAATGTANSQRTPTMKARLLGCKRHIVFLTQAALIGNLAVVIMLFPLFSYAVADEGVGALIGSWTGKGKILLKSLQAESIRCNSYNRRKGDVLALVVRCASTSYKVEIRSKLQIQGNALSGRWEERTYNATGEATGRFGNDSLSLAIKGGGFTGTMQANYSQNTLSMAIKTSGIDLESVNINLIRSNR
jgi:hypothetical protein